MPDVPDAPDAVDAPQGFWAEWRDAVSPRTVALHFGVLLLQLAFILSYVGAFHSPQPHQIPLAVVAGAVVAAAGSHLSHRRRRLHSPG